MTTTTRQIRGARWNLLLALVLPFAALAAAAPAPSQARFGVAFADGHAMCAMIDSADAAAGERVALVFPSLPQRVSWATLQAPAEAASPCASPGAHDLPGRRFELHLEQPMDVDSGAIGIVVRDAQRFASRHGRIVARLPHGHAWFRICSSSEGLHLAAWPTSRVAGTALWHAYVYLGYDTESDCSEAETRDPEDQSAASSTSRRKGTVILRLAASDARSSRSSSAVSPARSRPTRRSSQS